MALARALLMIAMAEWVMIDQYSAVAVDELQWWFDGALVAEYYQFCWGLRPQENVELDCVVAGHE